MRSFQEGSPYPNDYETVNTVTYLLARDEDCENAFHSTADFVSAVFLKFFDFIHKKLEIL